MQTDVREALVDMLYADVARPSCQAGLKERCRCLKCSRERARAALAASPQAEQPEGCTPADAMVLRKANHALADESHMLQGVLADLLKQVQDFCAENGEADFYTGPALAVLSKLRPLDHSWPFASPNQDEVLAKFAAAPKRSEG